jgi:hypothetical protein
MMLDLSNQDPADVAAAPRAAEAEALAPAGTFGAALRASPEYMALPAVRRHRRLEATAVAGSNRP